MNNKIILTMVEIIIILLYQLEVITTILRQNSHDMNTRDLPCLHLAETGANRHKQEVWEIGPNHHKYHHWHHRLYLVVAVT